MTMKKAFQKILQSPSKTKAITLTACKFKLFPTDLDLVWETRGEFFDAKNDRYSQPQQFKDWPQKTLLRQLPVISICVKVFKNGPSKICGSQPLKNLNWYGLPISLQIFSRLSSTNLTWSILEYLDPFMTPSNIYVDAFLQ